MCECVGVCVCVCVYCMLDVGGTDPVHREGERGSLSGLALITHQGTNDRESHRDKERDREREREGEGEC